MILESGFRDANAVPATFSSAFNYKWTPKTSVKRRKSEDPSYLLFKSEHIKSLSFASSVRYSVR